MNYEFPVINNISDVLPAIEGRPEFVVAVKDGGYTVINYNVNMSDTFPPIAVAGGSAKMRAERSLHNKLRRECRGIIFDTETGEILRRPYHKFFNVNEREETLAGAVDVSRPHVILEKLDGSMIVPFLLDGEIIWGTKMGATDVAKPVEEFTDERFVYFDFAMQMIDQGFSLIFEWCSRKQRIVLDYKEDQLILTAIRSINTGEYLSLVKMVRIAREYNIPVVHAFDAGNVADMQAFVEYTRGLEDTEGFVVRFDDGHMVKLKCDWYVQIHKAKEAILRDHNIVQLIIDNKLDDIKAHLPPEDVQRLNYFEDQINRVIVDQSGHLADAVRRERAAGDRKHFAINRAKDYCSYTKGNIFALWDVEDDKMYARALEVFITTVRSNTGKAAKWEELRSHYFDIVLPFNA